MAKKKAQGPSKISNRRAKHDYELGDSLVVGIELSGQEVKSLRMGHGQLKGAYVTIKGDELFLINALISDSPGNIISEEDKTRARKLLAKRREIDHFIELKKQGRTIIPLEILTSTRYIKLRISAGKGKKLYDKRQTLKKKDVDRQIARSLN